MHAHILQIIFIHFLVGLRRKSCETILVKEDAQGINSSHENIDSQIELQAIHKTRVIEVLLNHTVLTKRDISLGSDRDEDPLALAGGLWLNDEGANARAWFSEVKTKLRPV